MKTLIAIDPGASGGIAWSHAPNHSDAAKMPATESEVVELLREITERAAIESDDVEAHVERVGGFIGKAQPGSAMFKFGFGAGVIEGALRALTVRTIYHRPQEWQKSFGLGTASQCTTKTKWKQKLKAEASRRFPKLKVTNATADALLILEHGRGA